ncbi:MAG: PDGLE domain-containing protein [Promethearchaeota archaeon]
MPESSTEMTKTIETNETNSVKKPFSTKKWLLGIVIVLGLFIFVPVFLAGPDGFERVMEDFGIEAPGSAWYGLFGDYAIPGIDNPVLTSILAGVIGIGIMFSLMFLLMKVLKRRRLSEPTIS